LDGNEGVDKDIIEWLKVRIKGHYPDPPNLVMPFKKSPKKFNPETSSNGPLPKQDIYQLFGVSSD